MIDAARTIFGVKTYNELPVEIIDAIWKHPAHHRKGLADAFHLIAKTAVQRAKQDMVDDAL